MKHEKVYVWMKMKDMFYQIFNLYKLLNLIDLKKKLIFKYVLLILLNYRNVFTYIFKV